MDVKLKLKPQQRKRIKEQKALEHYHNYIVPAAWKQEALDIAVDDARSMMCGIDHNYHSINGNYIGWPTCINTDDYLVHKKTGMLAKRKV